MSERVETQSIVGTFNQYRLEFPKPPDLIRQSEYLRLLHSPSEEPSEERMARLRQSLGDIDLSHIRSLHSGGVDFIK
jgi:hypothetical protein